MAKSKTAPPAPKAVPSGLESAILTKLKEMVKLAKQIEALEEKVKPLAAAYNKLREQEIPDLMAEANITNMKVSGIGRVTVQGAIRASIKAGQGDAVRKWLESCGFGDMVTSTVQSSTLKAFLKKRIVEGEGYPDELFNVMQYSRVSITKS